MNNILLGIFLLLCSPADVEQNKEERKLNPFNEVKVGQAIKVYLHRSAEEKVVIETTNINPDEVETDVEDGRLRISLSGNRYRNINVRVDVYYRSIKNISASSASSISGEGVIRGDDFKISVSSAASVELKLDVNTLEIDASSSGDTKISGKAHEVEIDVSSAGGVNAYDLMAEIADVDASSAGNVRVHVTKSLKAHASSGGSIRYKGSPERTNTSSSSGGSIKRAD
jgi:hypothetical protein